MRIIEGLRDRDEQGSANSPLYAFLGFVTVVGVATMGGLSVEAWAKSKQACPPPVETHEVNDGESFTFDGSDANLAADLTVENNGGKLRFTYNNPDARDDKQLPRQADFTALPTFVGLPILTVTYPTTSACK